MNQIIVETKGEIVQAQVIESSLLDRFIAYVDAKPKTIETYKKDIKQFFKYLSLKGINQPTRADVLAYRDYLKIDRKPTTVQNYIIALRIFFQWTAQEGFYPNIADNIKGAKISKEHKKDYLTSKQIKKVLATIDRTTIKGLRDYAIVSLMVTCGLRDVEVSNANIEDIRSVGDDTALYILGKGRDEKTDYVKIMEPVEEAIRSYLTAAGITDVKQPLFMSLSNQNKGGRMTTRSISRIVKGSLMAAGFNSDKLTAHSLRHSAVTLSLLGGRSLQETQQFARHSNIATTTIYAHNLDRAKNQCEATISNAIF